MTMKTSNKTIQAQSRPSKDGQYTLGNHFGVPAVRALKFYNPLSACSSKSRANLTADDLRKIASILKRLPCLESNERAKTDIAQLRSLADQLDQASWCQEKGGTA